MGLLPEGLAPCCKFVLRINYNMGKNTEIKFVGQPIFKQVVNLIDGINLTSLIKKHNADCMGLICPTCFDEFDLGQIVLGKKYKKSLEVPVVYYFQLLGLAQGLQPTDVGLHMHKVKAHRLLDLAAA